MDDQTDQKPSETKPSDEQKKPETGPTKSFWNTLPGILAQLAVLIGAIAGLIVTLNNVGVIGGRATDTPTPTLTFTPTQTSTHTPTLTPTLTPIPPSTPTLTPTLAPTLTPTIGFLPTLTSTHTLTPVPVPKLELCVRLLGDRAVVREGPDTSTSVLGRLPVEACLIFDQRLPDNTWVRIAQEQRDPANLAFALGWVKSELLSEFEEIVHLLPYFGEDASNGYYCINTTSGMRVRECADIACRQTAILGWQECLIFDARLIDNSWLRIAVDQDNAKYFPLAGNWISSGNYSLVVREFQTFVTPHDMLPYFELLPVVTPPPTPQG